MKSTPIIPNPIRVALVEDILSLRQTIASLIQGTPGFFLAGTASTGEEAIERLPASSPNVVIMDIHLPKMNGIDCVRQLRDILPATEFMMLTVMEDDEVIFEALKAGATGYLVKREAGNQLLDSIRQLNAGGAPMSPSIARKVLNWMLNAASSPNPLQELTPTQMKVLKGLAAGQRNKEIAGNLGISEATVRTHCYNLYKKLQVNTRTEAVQVLHKNR